MSFLKKEFSISFSDSMIHNFAIQVWEIQEIQGGKIVNTFRHRSRVGDMQDIILSCWKIFLGYQIPCRYQAQGSFEYLVQQKFISFLTQINFWLLGDLMIIFLPFK